MDLTHFRMLTYDFLSRYPDIVPEEAPIIILDGKSGVCMARNGIDKSILVILQEYYIL